MTQKLPQHCWSHFLRSTEQILQFHSCLCHRAECFPLRISSPSKVEKRRGKNKNQKKKKSLQMENRDIMSTLMEKPPNTATLKTRGSSSEVSMQVRGCISGLWSCWDGPTRSWTKSASWSQQYSIRTSPTVFYVSAVLCSWYPVIFQVHSLVPGVFDRKTLVPKRLSSLTFSKVLIPPQPCHSSSP